MTTSIISKATTLILVLVGGLVSCADIGPEAEDEVFTVKQNLDTTWAGTLDVITATGAETAVISRASNHVEIFAVAGDLVARRFQNGWHPLQNLGKPSGTNLSGSVSAVRNGPNRVDVFATGTDERIWHKFRLSDNASWSSWQAIPIPALVKPDTSVSAVSWGANRIDVFYTMPSGNTGHTFTWASDFNNAVGFESGDQCCSRHWLQALKPGRKDTLRAISWGVGRIDLFNLRREGWQSDRPETLMQHGWYDNGSNGDEQIPLRGPSQNGLLARYVVPLSKGSGRLTFLVSAWEPGPGNSGLFFHDFNGGSLQNPMSFTFEHFIHSTSLDDIVMGEGVLWPGSIYHAFGSANGFVWQAFGSP